MPGAGIGPPSDLRPLHLVVQQPEHCGHVTVCDGSIEALQLCLSLLRWLLVSWHDHGFEAELFDEGLLIEVADDADDSFGAYVD